MARFLVTIVFLIVTIAEGRSQSSSDTIPKTISTDSVRVLSEVVVKAYAYDRPSVDVPVAIGIVGTVDLNRFSNTSLLPAVNSIPGVKMEERSPGSYRFAVRGSSLRSPFGVRNVKFYWNGLPLTDGGGNTYLNIIDFNALNSMEIIKGPGSSLYGAGTGGAVLLQPAWTSAKNMQVQYSLLTGSYGLFRFEAGGTLVASEKFRLDGRWAYQRADGYRQQTKMDRFTANLDWTRLLSKKSFLSGTFLVTNLNYQTPGGLTLAQYESDPSQARPASGTTPGAVEQKAEVKNNTVYLGLNLDHQWNENWSSRIGMFYSQTDFTNPTIRNYEKRKEFNWGGRTDTQYKFESSSIKGKITIGAEYQDFYSTLTDYDNLQGTIGNVQTDDKLWSQLFIGFAQMELELPKKFFLTLGGSATSVAYKFVRTSITPELGQYRNFDPVISPRVALLKKLAPFLSVYGSISNGFSPPSLAEVRPSTASINTSLNPERGTSYEAGLKGDFNLSSRTSRLEFTLAVYDFDLRDAIVIQRDFSGADYFVNAGTTDQRGAEVSLAWNKSFGATPLSSLRLWTSLTYNDYHFGSYVNDAADYSGNKLTGVAPVIATGGFDIQWRKGFYWNLTANYTDRIPLNDANTDKSSDYFLVGSRLGFRTRTLNEAGQVRRFPLEFFVGIDNALDQRYSLGNDLNAQGGRYYNAAPPRNYYAGIVAKIMRAPK